MMNAPAAPASRREYWMTAALDAITAFLLCSACIYIAFDLMLIENTPWQSLYIAFLATAFAFLCMRKWWIFPSILLIGALVLLAWAYPREEDFKNLELLLGFFSWIRDGLPTIEPYSFGGYLWIVKFAVALLASSVFYLFVRKFFSFLALGVLTLSSMIVLYYYKPELQSFATAMLFAALFITLPRVANRFVNKAGSGYIPRWPMQLIGIPAAILCIGLAFLIVPQGSEVWRSQRLTRLVYDLNDVASYYSGTASGGGQSALEPYGYMPLSTRLGGDIDLDDTRILSVRTKTPDYLRGTVYDSYDGKQWYDGHGDYGHFRLESLFWRSQRREAFGGYLPTGNREALRLYETISREQEFTIMPVLNSLNTYHTNGNTTAIKSATYGTAIDPYFNRQGELYTASGSKVQQSYVLQSTAIMKSSPMFERTMKQLQDLQTGRDPYYKDIQGRYTQIYPEFPQRVHNLSNQLTQGLSYDVEKALAIEAYLSENCAYTTTPGTPPENVDFVEHFLETGQGYCTYFASAMAMMARSAGLPARYVTGFGLRVQSFKNQQYYALASSAHAWCEIYFEGVGWVAFDPVPWEYSYPSQGEGGEESGPSQVIDPILEDPSEEDTPQELTDLPEATIEEPAETPLALRVFNLLVTPLLIVIALYLLYRYSLGRKFRRYALERVLRKFPDDNDRVEYYFSDIGRQLTHWHLQMEPGETVAAFCSRCAHYLDIEGAGIEAVGQIVSRRFYGNKPITQEDLRALYHVHHELEQRLRLLYGNLRYFFLRAIQ